VNRNGRELRGPIGREQPERVLDVGRGRIGHALHQLVQIRLLGTQLVGVRQKIECILCLRCLVNATPA
jgi:hypothetical protein